MLLVIGQSPDGPTSKSYAYDRYCLLQSTSAPFSCRQFTQQHAVQEKTSRPPSCRLECITQSASALVVKPGCFTISPSIRLIEPLETGYGCETDRQMSSV